MFRVIKGLPWLKERTQIEHSDGKEEKEEEGDDGKKMIALNPEEPS